MNRKYIFAVTFAMFVAALLLVSNTVFAGAEGNQPNRGASAALNVPATVGPTKTPCNAVPAKPKGLNPVFGQLVKQHRVNLSWNPVRCVQNYVVTVRRGSTVGPIVFQKGVPTPPVKTGTLQAGNIYYWQVEACNFYSSCTKSDWSTFLILF